MDNGKGEKPNLDQVMEFIRSAVERKREKRDKDRGEEGVCNCPTCRMGRGEPVDQGEGEKEDLLDGFLDQVAQIVEILLQDGINGVDAYALIVAMKGQEGRRTLMQSSPMSAELEEAVATLDNHLIDGLKRLGIPRDDAFFILRANAIKSRATRKKVTSPLAALAEALERGISSKDGPLDFGMGLEKLKEIMMGSEPEEEPSEAPLDKGAN